jgi:catechol 2,3-dioxygenase
MERLPVRQGFYPKGAILGPREAKVRASPGKMASPDPSQGADQVFVTDPNAQIGHVHLKVADLDRALKFYSGVLGFQVTQRLGDGAAFLSAGGYHHHVALSTWQSLDGAPPATGTTGLYHTAILYPTRAALAEVFRRVLAAGIPLEGAADHGVSESVYPRDPDGNGVELYWDRPKNQWPRTPDGGLAMFTGRLDLRDLLNQAPPVVDLSPGPRDL